ncbi:hypothetical protein RhiirA5_493960 [Rhizophagus irregularis]|uniref:MULE transposase domain-containing protein n=1 Tax=Rhizophagus irregularis TaxID=588596 RepID=A0A2N0QAT2_9GLOM|nr:hypothetical protein RhiirA5_493960 [Rhizophagus irregularis]PKC66810.1 hypothetical protein RhiirA1_535349 [Rhizophagus irregularis]
MDPLTEAFQTINDDNIIAIYKNIPVTKRCSGCKKTIDKTEFIVEENIRSTCNTCRSKNNLHKNNQENIEYNNQRKQKLQFEFTKIINIPFSSEEPKKIADIIIENIQDSDDYKWKYVFIYICAQSNATQKNPRKHQDLTKQRDTPARERFACKGVIKIDVKTRIHCAQIQIKHDELHTVPSNFTVSDWVKNYISENLDLFPTVIYKQLVSKELDISIQQKQVYYWWSYYMTRNKSTWILTGFHKELQEKNICINECGIDATYNTNNLTFELYVLLAEVNGSGYPLGYLFLDNNGNGISGARTNTITKFLREFQIRGILPQFFLTDKDFAQISAAQEVWPNTKIQLCHCHLRRAVETKLKETTLPKRDNYEPIAANHEFSFIDIEFNPSNKAYKATRISGMIRKQAVFEMYTYCINNSLVWVWSYMWREWYIKDRWKSWNLWARSAFNTLSILKTTMIVEGHWKVLKRDYLYKFFRPRLDLLVYTLLEKLLPLQHRKFQQILSGRETLDWKKSLKSEWKKLA